MTEEPMGNVKFTHLIIPRYHETDQMGIIHHSVYPVWYEEGRVRFCDKIGMPFDYIESLGLFHAMIELKVHYIKPAYFNQPLTLNTFVKKLSKVRLTFGYELVNETGEIINEGETLLAWLNKDLKPINLRKAYPEIYTLLLKYCQVCT